MTQADLRGKDQRVIPAAMDTVARMGGGTVKLLPGRSDCGTRFNLCSNIRLEGSGGGRNGSGEGVIDTSKLSSDSTGTIMEIHCTDAKGFQVGDGICLRAKNPHHGGQTVIKRTLVARSGNRSSLDKGLRGNLWAAGTPTASTLFPNP